MSEINVTTYGISDARKTVKQLQAEVESIQIAPGVDRWNGCSTEGMNKLIAGAMECRESLIKLLVLTNYKLAVADAEFKETDEELAEMHRVFGVDDANRIIAAEDGFLFGANV